MPKLCRRWRVRNGKGAWGGEQESGWRAGLSRGEGRRPQDHMGQRGRLCDRSGCFYFYHSLLRFLDANLVLCLLLSGLPFLFLVLYFLGGF